MTGRRGICAAGNLIADLAYTIERYPARGELTSIVGGREASPGGLAANVALSLAKLDSGLPVYVCGRVGDDAEGRFLLARFAEHPSIHVDGILTGGATAYTLALTEQETAERTFFTSRGASADFDVEDVDFDTIPARIFHAGYVLLLDALDKEDPEYGTRMSRLLRKAREHGLRTSVDVVSEAGGRFTRLVPPALKYADYCVINEYEAQKITGVPLREDGGSLVEGNMEKALHTLGRMGVSRWCVIHCPEGAYGLDTAGLYTALPSLSLPKGFIKGTTGAGDAFAAGVLYAAHEDWPFPDALRLGIAAAACSLSGADSYGGILPWREAMRVYQEMGGE